MDKVADKLHIENKHILFLTPDKEKEIDGINVMSLSMLISSGGKVPTPSSMELSNVCYPSLLYNALL